MSADLTKGLELIRRLYQRADGLMAEAEEAINSGDVEAARPPLLKAQEIISELLKALDFEKGGELAENLRRLYIFVWERLVLASLSGDLRSLGEARVVWTKLWAAWEEVSA
jgi:flagellar protein FliS